MRYDHRAARVEIAVVRARVVYTGKTAVIRGVGRHRGKTVRFTATVRDVGKRDVFRITLSDGYRRGGAVARGFVQVR